jgi:hypothetical protein
MDGHWVGCRKVYDVNAFSLKRIGRVKLGGVVKIALEVW